MKTIIKSFFVIFLSLIMIMPINAFATESNNNSDYDIILSSEEINYILSMGNTYTSAERATGLIESGSVGINNQHKMLQLVALINCHQDVVKCGFEDIIVQRRASSSSSWTDYHQFDDDYYDTYANTIIKAVTVVTGYEYRVICTFYAKKNIFSVQRIDAESNILAF